MATTLASPQVSAGITASLTSGAAPATANSNVNHGVAQQFTAGSSAGNINRAYSTAFTVDTGSPTDLDLTALVDPLGGAINFGTINAILLENLSTTGGQDLSLGAGTTPVFAAALGAIAYAGTIPGFIHWSGGSTGKVVDSTHKILRIAAAAGAAVSAKITIIGKT